MIPRLAWLALFPFFAAVVFFGAFWFFYRSGDGPAPAVNIPFQQIESSAAPPGDFVDSPQVRTKRGLFLIDAVHANAFREMEIITLRSRVASRGYDVELVGNFSAESEETRLALLEEKLRRADSFMTILPRSAYTDAEVAVVERFVRKGGKLLLISDPTRPQKINGLAERFGLEFQPDYLYNVAEYDLNFQNIYVRDFGPDQLTTGLDAVVLYTAGSIRSAGPGVAFTDAATQSSVVGSTGRLNPIVRGNNRNVVGISDLTFLIPPHNAVLDNDRLVSNIADYLTSSEREYDLADFPHFYNRSPNDSVDILVGQPSVLNAGVAIRNGLSEIGLSSQLQDSEDISRDTVFVGLYEDAPQMARYLQASGIAVGDTLETPYAPGLALSGTAITALARTQNRYILTVLADTPETLNDAVEQLLTGDFRNHLVSDHAGVTTSSIKSESRKPESRKPEPTPEP